MQEDRYCIKDASNIYFTSDTHFNHSNIIRFCSRPFHDVNEMNEILIQKWNEVVPNDGIVYHLGDFAWGNYVKWEEIRKRLNGNIVLIRGNHDYKNGKNTERLFDSVYPQLYLNIEGRNVLLNHFPFLCYGGTYRSSKDVVYQLFGHVHTSKDMNGLDKERMKFLFPSQYDVGVDNNDFKPISWYEVDKIIQEKIKEYDSNNT